MNNRYLCKAKDKDDGRWYEGYYLLLHDTTYCCMPSDNAEETKRFEEKNTHHYIVFEQMTDWGLPNRHLRAEILPETLCQCTGLKDKNGKLIWENDIATGWFDEEHIVGYIRYGSNGCFYIERNGLYGIPIGNSQDWLELCGNRFDNPELLEVWK